ncbi:MAG: biosynthetic peptidoglycan transglycosylase [Alphaproteobacteria bacterium]
MSQKPKGVKPKPRKPAARKAPAKKADVRTVDGETHSSLLWRATKWSLVAAIWGGLAIGAILVWFAWDLPPIDGLSGAADKSRRPGVTIAARDGSLIAGYGDLYGARLSVNELPPELIQAVVAIEDRRFFEHRGVDFRGLARAMLANLRAGGVVQGGSTLSQQLAKNLFLTPERSYTRKIRELLLALALENRFQKDELLTIYLNRVYLGAGTYGVEAASQRYFGMSVREIERGSCVRLRGSIPMPTPRSRTGVRVLCWRRWSMPDICGGRKPKRSPIRGVPGGATRLGRSPGSRGRRGVISPTGCWIGHRATRAIRAVIWRSRRRSTRACSALPKTPWPAPTRRARKWPWWRCGMTAPCWRWSAGAAIPPASSTV